jgi:curved DNA-binding protein CbpA
VNNDDLYTILGVHRSATAAQIKERFRFLSHAYHPDKFAADAHRRTAEEQFMRVNEAYQVLSDPVARARYDSAHSTSSNPPSQRAPRQASPSTPPRSKRSGLFRAFKVIAMCLVALVALAGVGLFGLRAHLEASKHRITPSEIELVDLALKENYGGWSYQLTGRIRNHSVRYTVQTVLLKLTMREIQSPAASEIVGEDNVFLIVSVPPGQTRNVSGYVRFRDLPKPSGRLEWSYTITQITGQ